jgi:riboflavin synthase
VCLTVERISATQLQFRAVAQTVSRSTLAQLRSGSRVNLERSLSVGGRLDGHFVLGHVDGVGTVISDEQVGDSLLRTIEIPPELSALCAPKGSIAIDGISLTIASADAGRVTLSLIPYSLRHTTMQYLSRGDRVNIECDVLARYITHFHATQNGSTAPLSGNTGPQESILSKMERLNF